jgi:hypothetical protein
LDELVFEVLEYVADLSREFRDVCLAGVSTTDADCPVERPVEEVGDQAVERFTECRFPAAVSADDGGKLTRIDAQIRPLQYRLITTGVLECQVVNDDAVCGHK